MCIGCGGKYYMDFIGNFYLFPSHKRILMISYRRQFWRIVNFKATDVATSRSDLWLRFTRLINALAYKFYKAYFGGQWAFVSSVFLLQLHMRRNSYSWASNSDILTSDAERCRPSSGRWNWFSCSFRLLCHTVLCLSSSFTPASLLLSFSPSSLSILLSSSYSDSKLTAPRLADWIQHSHCFGDSL